MTQIAVHGSGLSVVSSGGTQPDPVLASSVFLGCTLSISAGTGSPFCSSPCTDKLLSPTKELLWGWECRDIGGSDNSSTHEEALGYAAPAVMQGIASARVFEGVWEQRRECSGLFGLQLQTFGQHIGWVGR
jgi:hypothetical protein